jgi:N-acetyl-gamma-glutamyl-phosphate reductase
MLPKVFIDGHTGTTGLRIHQWMAGREDVELLTLPQELRRNPEDRRGQVLESDVAILCLPDDAALEVAEWVQESDTRLIDASTAHRVADGWAYGLPELEPGQRETIGRAKQVSNPGCYPTGFILLVRPLIDAGLLAEDAPLSINALSGYSGGGNGLISKWEDPNTGLAGLPYEAPYALYQRHKHIPEMMKYAGVSAEPQFVPAVGPFRCGMRVQVPVHSSLLEPGLAPETAGEKVWEALYERYQGEEFVEVARLPEPGALDERSFNPEACNDSNRIQLHVAAHPSGHVLLIALLDNLGKGACGAAIQNLNLMLGFEEGAGLPDPA